MRGVRARLTVTGLYILVWPCGCESVPRPNTVRVRVDDAAVRMRELRRTESLARSLPGARRTAIKDDCFAPELAKLHSAPPEGPSWLHEVKWDGYRMLASISQGRVHLWSRDGTPWSEQLLDLRRAVGSLGIGSGRLDGELVAMVAGRPSLSALQRTLAGEQQSVLVYVLFDLPALEGFDLSNTPLVARKSALRSLLGPRPPDRLAYSPHRVGDGARAFALASAENLEGIICKRADSSYRGGRGNDWIEVKNGAHGQYAVVGYTPGTRTGIGTLLLASPQGNRWRYVGRMAEGVTQALFRELIEALASQRCTTAPVENFNQAPRNTCWVEPRLVAEVFLHGTGYGGLLRPLSLKAMRPDKSIDDVRREQQEAMDQRAVS